MTYDFNLETGQLIAELNSVTFPKTLDAALHKVAEFDLTAVVAFPLGEKPQLLHDGLGHISSKIVMNTYLNSTYVLDAVYVACRKGVSNSLYRLSELAPDEFFATHYYNSPDVHPCISLESGSLTEEIVYISQPADGFYLCYSLMRSSRFEQFSAEEFEKLNALKPIVQALLAKHFSKYYIAREAPLKRADASALDAAFANFKTDVLSPREQHIVSLVLRGHSSASIANVLNIAEGTVKNHRKHIHAKLGVASQGELFNEFLKHLLNF